MEHYAQYGDPDGKPVFYFHGTPGSRLEHHPDDAIARGRGARIITADRPGFGHSDFQLTAHSWTGRTTSSSSRTLCRSRALPCAAGPTKHRMLPSAPTRSRSASRTSASLAVSLPSTSPV